MSRARLAGALWLVAGISSGAIAFFIADALTLAVFIAGAVLAIVLGLALVLRLPAATAGVSALQGAAWAVAFGAVVVGNLSAPIEEVLSVVWVLVFGVAAGFVAYARRPSAAVG